MSVFKYKGYQGSIEVSPEDKCLYGKIRFIEDLVLYEGQTVVELEKAFQESLDNYLETCRNLGKDPEKPFKGSFNVRLSPALHKEVSVKAGEEGKSLNEFIVEAVQMFVEQKKDVSNQRQPHRLQSGIKRKRRM